MPLKTEGIDAGALAVSAATSLSEEAVELYWDMIGQTGYYLQWGQPQIRNGKPSLIRGDRQAALAELSLSREALLQMGVTGARENIAKAFEFATGDPHEHTANAQAAKNAIILFMNALMERLTPAGTRPVERFQKLKAQYLKEVNLGELADEASSHLTGRATELYWYGVTNVAHMLHWGSPKPSVNGASQSYTEQEAKKQLQQGLESFAHSAQKDAVSTTKALRQYTAMLADMYKPVAEAAAAKDAALAFIDSLQREIGNRNKGYAVALTQGTGPRRG